MYEAMWFNFFNILSLILVSLFVDASQTVVEHGIFEYFNCVTLKSSL